MIDYKELLAKYIEHVSGCEGVDFIPKHINKKGKSIDPFTREELFVLWECAGWSEREGKYL